MVSRVGFLAPLAVATVACLALVSAAVALGHGSLDRSFGARGVVDVNRYLASSRSLGAVAVAPDGAIYFTEDRLLCGRGGCPYSLRLKRLRPGGSPDPRFGAAGRSLSANVRSFALLATDGAGRVVAAWNQAENGRDGIFVRRFGRAGSLDRSFGRAGTLHLDCGCYLNSLTALTGGRLLVGGESEVPGRKSTRWLFARLLSNGAPDGGFGDRGQVLLTRRFFSPSAVAPTPGGGVLLAGLRQRGYDNSMPYVLRLSSSGRIDGRYGAATRRALHGVYETGRDDVGWEGLSLVSRPGGGVTVFGRAYRRGIAVGLLPDGGRDRSFGKGGVTLLPFDLSDAVTDGRGGAFAVGYLPYRPRRPYAYAVLRVQGDGRISRGFGRVGLPDAYNEYGLSIFPSDRGPVVLARGESVCRGYCPSHPRMFRLAPLRGGP